MEGTKNERSVVIITSYIIGFITAFIMFHNYSVNNDTFSETAQLLQPEPASVITSTLETSDVSTDYSTKPFALTSDNKRFSFYCEKSNPTEDYCKGYIHDSSDDSVHEIKINDINLTMSEGLIEDVKWVGNTLTIGSTLLSNDVTPWVLIDTTTPIDLEN